MSFHDAVMAIVSRAKAASNQALNEIAEAQEPELKASAPWGDQSGEARRQLTLQAEANEDEGFVRAAHGVDYGPDLEMGKGGETEHLYPSVLQLAPKAIDAVAQKVRGVL